MVTWLIHSGSYTVGYSNSGRIWCKFVSRVPGQEERERSARVSITIHRTSTSIEVSRQLVLTAAFGIAATSDNSLDSVYDVNILSSCVTNADGRGCDFLVFRQSRLSVVVICCFFFPFHFRAVCDRSQWSIRYCILFATFQTVADKHDRPISVNEKSTNFNVKSHTLIVYRLFVVCLNKNEFISF